jgi:hypothetical protein
MSDSFDYMTTLGHAAKDVMEAAAKEFGVATKSVPYSPIPPIPTICS